MRFSWVVKVRLCVRAHHACASLCHAWVEGVGEHEHYKANDERRAPLKSQQGVRVGSGKFPEKKDFQSVQKALDSLRSGNNPSSLLDSQPHFPFATHGIVSNQ